MDWFVLILLILFFGGLSLGAISLAPWVPTRKKDFIRVDKLARLKPGDSFVELGCGAAGLVLYLAKKYPQTKFVGIEIAWPLFLVAWIRIKLFSFSNVEIMLKNIFKHNLSQYNIIFTYGLRQKAHSRLIAKIKKECPSGCRVISYAFPLPGIMHEIKDKPSAELVAIYKYQF